MMMDPARTRKEALASALKVASGQLAKSAEVVEDLKALLPTARNARERTALNIVIDDQKKVMKALERLVKDLEDLA
jgi:hypothetical protein